MPRIPRAHGLGEVVVRGTVIQVVPGKPPHKWLRWLLEGKHPVVRITIDDEPFAQLDDFLRDRGQGVRVEQTFQIVWGPQKSLPSKDDRVFITFSYSGELQSFFEGAPPLNLKNIEPVVNEADVHPNELFETEMRLPLKHA